MAIILLTILVKVVLLPLTISQLRYTKKMSLIQPKLKEIQEKYKKDKEMYAAKAQEVYKEHKVNPFIGCLPTLIQLPILIGLFNTLRNPMQYVFAGFEQMGALATSQPFLWVHDLSKADYLSNIINLGGTMNMLPGVLPILSALTTYIQMDMMNASGTSTAKAVNDQMNMMKKVMPVMILFMGYSMPAGLMIYWTVSNLFQIVQQYVTNQIAKRTEVA
jgi:YidC/Oxa1 family membrane protein insertase